MKLEVSSLLVVCLIAVMASFAQGEMMFTNTTLEINGANINVVLAANNISNFEGGQPVVLLHGFPEGWYGWIDLVPELLDLDNYSLIIPDLPGFNMSQGPGELSQYQIETMAQEVYFILTHIASSVTLIGHDWGGIVSWVIAHNYPNFINGLVILNSPNPSAWWEAIQTYPPQQNASDYILLFDSPEGYPYLSANNFSNLVNAFTGEDWFFPREQIYIDAWTKDLNTSLNYYRANIYGDPSSWSTMQTNLPLDCTVDVPTLVLWGLRDPALTPEILQLLPKYVSNLQIESFANGTHWLHHDMPEVIAPIINTFILNITSYSDFIDF